MWGVSSAHGLVLEIETPTDGVQTVPCTVLLLPPEYGGHYVLLHTEKSTLTWE